MPLFDIIAVLLAATALFAWLNRLATGIPNAVGLLLMGLLASVALMATRAIFPGAGIFQAITALIDDIDFSRTLLDGMLAFLLFAGALQIDVSDLRERRWIVMTMAVAGTMVSTLVVAAGLWLASGLTTTPIPFVWTLVFGALISPTDPVAVLSTLKQANVPRALEMDIAGEALFNDGVGVVLFTMLLSAATSDAETFSPVTFTKLFLLEAVGGGALGWITGYGVYRAMRLIDDYSTEVLISLALVTGTYALATRLHVSGPIAVVVAGVLIGNRGAQFAMSETTRRYLFGFWSLIGQMLNSVLFLLIGLEVLVLTFSLAFVPLALAAVPIVLFARCISVTLPLWLLILVPRCDFARGTIPILTWAGIRGGISIALVLALPESPFKAVLCAATYTVSVFTIVVQGLTLERVVARYKPA